MSENQPVLRGFACFLVALGMLLGSTAFGGAQAASDSAKTATDSAKATSGSAKATGDSAAGKPSTGNGARAALERIGRAATPAEIKAWDIDVRADFKGLPEGSGSVSDGETIWETKCASCHGIFGESNEVFTPLVGGTSEEDIETGRVQHLAQEGYPHRTTLMKASTLSTLWDYINRAMPWNEPKSLEVDEVYAVLAFMLNLGEIVASDFTLSDRNMAQIQQRLPNRDGKLFYEPMWVVGGSGDVSNPACMDNCPVAAGSVVILPVAARNTHGNIADQVRPFGPARGTNTAPPDEQTATGRKTETGNTAETGKEGETGADPNTKVAAAVQPPGGSPDGRSLIKANACVSCHGVDKKIIGPGFQEIAAKHAQRSDLIGYLTDKILNGGQGVWGPIPMPGQAQVKEADAKAIAAWIAEGAK